MGGEYTYYYCKEDNCEMCKRADRSYCVCCGDNKYAYKGKCIDSCPNKTFVYMNEANYNMCLDCYSNCETCNGDGIANDMKCLTCPEDKIKYNENCYEIVNNYIKIFANPGDDNKLTSCYQLYHKYIIEKTNECIDKPDKGYYVSNEITGLLSPCHKNCETCQSGEEIDSNGKLMNMKCKTCKKFLINDDNQYLRKLPIYNNSKIDEIQTNNTFPTMIKIGENCFLLLAKESNKIIFDISEIYPEEKNGTCFFFNETIFTGNMECIGKLENTYYANSNIEDKDIINNCSEACKTCFKGSTPESIYCTECSDGYYHLSSDNVPYNCYKNETSINKCYHTCLSCEDSPIINEAGDTIKQNCLECKKDYHKMEGTNNCYNDSIIEKGYYLSSNDSKYYRCDIECKTCTNNNICIECNLESGYERDKDGIKCKKKSIDKTSSTEFKNQISNNITSFVNSSALINGSDFIAVVLSSEQLDPKEQIKKGISAIDLGNCTEQLKEYYNISKDESLIILNMESKRDESKINTENDNNAIEIGKSSQIEIYDNSGRKLELIVCKDDIKILKYIGDLKDELYIDTAMNLAESGVDIFDSTDDFFNNICHEYDNSDGKDIVIVDRRNDIYKNISFCDLGCIYNGMDYELMIANCICDTNILESGIENNNTKNIGSGKDGFNSIKSSIIASLIDCNFEVFNCYNLVFNIKYLKNNIGFYFMSILFILQCICLLIYLYKRLKSIKIFLLIFKDKNSKDVKFFPPPKNENNILINTMKDSKEKKLIDKSLKNNSIKIKINKENSINFKNKNIKNKENNKLVKMENEINSKRKLNSLDEDNSINIEIPLDNKNNNKIDTTRGIRGKQLIFSPIVNIEAPLINIMQNTQIIYLKRKKKK